LLCERSSQDVATQRAEGRARSASKPRLPARQAGTLAAELTRQNEKLHPVTGSGAALSLRPISTLEA
jgi:hypothetical protein